jgi:glucose uptake protein GlcU
MALVIPGVRSSVETTPSGIVRNAELGADVVFSAIIAGIALYFINKSFLGNVPVYVSIIAGFLISMYLGQYTTVKALGFALMADGLYKLIKENLTINSSS